MQRTIKIDLDKKGIDVLRTLVFRLNYCSDIFPEIFNGHVSRVMETKKGYHVYISLKKPIGDLECVIFQAALGSDWLRELRNYNRIRAGDEVWNILFSTKIRKGKVQHEKPMKWRD